MDEEARRYAFEERRAVHVGSICGGMTEGLFKLRGFEDGYMDLVADPALARRLMERILEVKLTYWSQVLPQLAGLVDVVSEADDLGGQDRTLFSPATYRALVKPLHRELFAFLHAHTDAKVFFHTCGAVRELIPDLIEIGVDVLNPVQVSAAGMETAALKREFGRDLVFWGGGVDTQRVLGSGTPDEVRAEVRRRVGDLAPGGGFVFAAVHNVQPNVPPENVLAMRSAAPRGRAGGLRSSVVQSCPLLPEWHHVSVSRPGLARLEAPGGGEWRPPRCRDASPLAAGGRGGSMRSPWRFEA